MPEGPEIRRAADRLGKLLIGRPLVAVWFAFPELARQADTLLGLRVTEVDSWGKALLTRFEDGRVLYSHNQLYGRWMLHAWNKPPSTSRSLRAQLATQTHAASLYSASDISLHDGQTLSEHPFLSRLGPDLLTHQVTPEDVMQRLLLPRFRRRGLGGLLLDQRCYAGIGNYLRSEMLFFAGLRPQRRPESLTPGELERMAQVMVATMAQAYHEAGVTNRREWRLTLQEAGLPRRVWRHAVFDRAGAPCHCCGAFIEKISVASRRLYLCPRCQQ
ncbi:endonuclease VIII [Halomonas sp. ML-15]|uniref:endonuclease VIII n=1 Tax=Halomonas sp. ML-15 TaxID=2773305 RepID=UPI001747C768|nr:endonuclease VIII [Halomonas sp. ML-15]MBD3894323.1 endonuclease VIII [Halomonas sp. ML-15]